MQDGEFFCPSCGMEMDHAIIRTGQKTLVKCEECGTVHGVHKEREKKAAVRVIVSIGDVSQPYHIKLPAKDLLRVGDQLLVDDETKEVVLTEITSLETDKRVESASADTVRTVWARAIDDIALKVSVYKQGKTRSLKSVVPGEEEFEVGEVREMEGLKFRVVKIKLRGEGFADKAEAKDIIRVWGRAL